MRKIPFERVALSIALGKEPASSGSSNSKSSGHKCETLPVSGQRK